MRAKKSKRGEKAILKDGYVEKLVNSIKYDYSKFNTAKPTCSNNTDSS